MKTSYLLSKTLLVLLCLAPAAVSAEGPQVFAIRGARVVRVSGPPMDNGTVVVRDGLIESVGANVTVPADAWVIEGKGLTVYPGLMDAMSTWGIPGAGGGGAGARRGGGAAAVAAAPAGPQPVIRGPEDRPSNTSYLKAADLIVPTDASVEAGRGAGFTTAATFPTSNIFAGQGAIFDLAGDRSGAMIVSPSAGMYLTMRSAGGFRSFPGSLMGVMAYIHQIYLDADHYTEAKQIYASHPAGLQRPAYDRVLEAVLETPRVLLPAAREVEVDRMIKFAKELNRRPVLYGGEEGWRAVDMLKQAGAPMLVSLKWPERSRDADPALEDSLHTLEMREKAPSTPAALAAGGVKFAFYSDGVAPTEIAKAVRRAMEAGLTPADAVRAFTLSPAEIYGVADRLGSIDKGKIANLVVTEGELFQDKTKVKYVFVDGMKYEPVAPAPPARRNVESAQ